MKEYFISVIAVSLLGGVIISLLPDVDAAKHVRLLCSLCTVACIAFPLVSLFDSGIDVDAIGEMFEQSEERSEKYDEIYNGTLNEYEIINAQNTLKQEIIQRIGADASAFDLKIITNKNSDVIYISSVRVCIYGSGVSIDPKEVKKYVQDRLGCDCEIVYDIF